MKRIAAAIVVAGTVVAVAVILLVGRGSGPGPLAWPSDAGSSWFAFRPLKPGEIAVVGLPLTQGNNLPIVLLDVHPLPSDDASGLSIRYAASTGAGMQVGSATGWHPKKWQLRPVAGFVIPAFEPGGLLVGVSASKPRRYVLHGFVVDYKVGDTRYSTTQQMGLKARIIAPSRNRG